MTRKFRTAEAQGKGDPDRNFFTRFVHRLLGPASVPGSVSEVPEDHRTARQQPGGGHWGATESGTAQGISGQS